jgi:hypothetical protein
MVLISDSSAVIAPPGDSGTTVDLSRPVLFMVPFWGERYRRYFVERLLPSLLAPNNLPLLRADEGHRFLIATTPEDWAAIVDLPIIRRLRQHATPTLIEIPKPTGETAPGSTSAILHQDVALKLLAKAAFQGKGYGSLMWPDCIISDGMVASLIKHARAGRHLVLCPALRQAEESAISELKNRGLVPDGSSPAENGATINIPQRVLADLMVRHLHPEMAKFEEGAPDQPLLAPFRYWRLPNDVGIILHTFHSSPMLLDYGTVVDHDLACLERGSFEDVYVAHNFGAVDQVHVVRDSDEFCIASFTPTAVGQISSVMPADRIENDGESFIRCGTIAVSISFHAARMPLKRILFQKSVRWHGRELDQPAIKEEDRISAFIDRAVRHSRYTRPVGTMLSAYLGSPLLASSIPYLRFLLRAMLGDRHKLAHIRRRISFTLLGPFKRALFRFSSGGRDLDRYDPLHLSFRSTLGRKAVSAALFSASPDTAVILGIGQSNIANECDPGALYQPKGGVYNFNFFDGRCYEARDPLLGASINRSNVLTKLGDLLIERGQYHRILLAPIAHGGTYAREWSPAGRMFPRLEWTLERLKQSKINITHIFWQQGESEAALRDPKPDEWVRHFMAMVGAIRAAGAVAPIYVAQCTICRNDPNEQIRQVQRGVVDPAAGILAGPDLDLVGRDERFDGCHFSAGGLQHAAALWYEALCPSH